MGRGTRELKSDVIKKDVAVFHLRSSFICEGKKMSIYTVFLQLGIYKSLFLCIVTEYGNRNVIFFGTM